ncbi:MAG: transposase [Patescibacteria group bacterium]|nr:transposase [Patescibacteria group bacterium]
MRKVEFANDEYYHIYNRGVDKRDVFCDEKDYARFLTEIKEFNTIEAFGGLYTKYLRNRNKKIDNGDSVSSVETESPLSILALVEIICYCFNPNHYHFILKQLVEGGISKFMHKIGVGYSMYFNQKYDRSGALFQGKFKAKHIDTNEYLLWLSGYVNGNVEIHKMSKVRNYNWCSYPDYLGLRCGTLCNKEIILSQFKNLEEYENYVNIVIDESEKRKDLEKYFIE